MVVTRIIIKYENDLSRPAPLTLCVGGPYHIETSPLICSANQWAGFYMIGTSVVQGLMSSLSQILHVLLSISILLFASCIAGFLQVEK